MIPWYPIPKLVMRKGKPSRRVKSSRCVSCEKKGTLFSRLNARISSSIFKKFVFVLFFLPSISLANVQSCSDLYNSSSIAACDSQDGCTVEYSGSCSGYDQTSCTTTAGCTASYSFCTWNFGGNICDGGYDCSTMPDQTSCESHSIDPFTSCSGSPYVSCSGTYDDGETPTDATFTTEEQILYSLSFGNAIEISLMSLILIAFIYNSMSQRKKPWQK